MKRRWTIRHGEVMGINFQEVFGPLCGLTEVVEISQDEVVISKDQLRIAWVKYAESGGPMLHELMRELFPENANA